MGIGDWGLAQSPIPNPQSPIPNPQKSFCKKNKNFKFLYEDFILLLVINS